MKLLQVDAKGDTVADLGPPVPEDPPAAVPEAQIEFYGQIMPPDKIKRPSLEVETEVHAHLAPRVEAHLRRIETWDVRSLDEARRIEIAAAVASLREAFCTLGDVLGKLRDVCFIAKTTPTSRKRAALRPGTAVKLRPDIYADTVGLFCSEEELASLTVSKVGESSVLLATSGGRELGPFPFSHVVLA
jgi:hypothetical protein